MDYWDIFAIEQTHYNEGHEAGLVEGKVLGIAEGEIQMLVKLVKRGLLSLQDAASQAGMSESAFKAQMDK